MFRSVLLCFFVLFLGTSGRAQKERTPGMPRPAAAFDSLNRELQVIADRNDIAGFGVALVTAEGVVFESGYGYADVVEKRAYTSRTVQNIGSISKTFIGVALVQAERAGLLSLDDPINKYLPFRVVHPRHPGVPILLRHLANHTAGIHDGKMYNKAYSLLTPLTVATNQVPAREYREMRKMAGNEFMPLEAFLKAFLTPPGKFYRRQNFTKEAPGTVYRYSNVGAALAAHVLEVATGQSFPEWTKQHIFTPLEMGNTGWFAEDVTPESRAVHHFSNGMPMPDYVLSTYPDGGLLTSVHDLGQFCAQVIAGRAVGNAALPAEGYARLFRDPVRVPGEEQTYGIFWEQLDSGFYGHTGGDPGIVTIMYVNAESGVGHLVFFNGHTKRPEMYMEVFRQVLKWGKRWITSG